MRTLPLIAALALVSACTSLEDIRQSEPIRTGTYPTGFEELATCVVYETAPRHRLDHLVLQKSRKAIVSYTQEVDGPLGTLRSPMWEMTISENDAPGISLVEFRMASVADGGSRWLKSMWPIVEECGNHRPVSAQR